KYHEQPSGDISFDHAEGETSTEKPIVNQNETSPYPELMQSCLANDFLKRFEIDDRAVVSHIFHHWAKRQAFQIPKRLLDKIKFVIDERLRGKGYKRKVTSPFSPSISQLHHPVIIFMLVGSSPIVVLHN
uniref:Uncharacterized protein n=1 Tax=Aegilops tauschii subsp. strangulata TaxID=200361 RepID=A0A453BHF3_AEGTS